MVNNIWILRTVCNNLYTKIWDIFCYTASFKPRHQNVSYLRVLFNSHSKKHVTNSPHCCLTRLFYSVVTKHGYININTIKIIDSSLKINLDNMMDWWKQRARQTVKQCEKSLTCVFHIFCRSPLNLLASALFGLEWEISIQFCHSWGFH